MEKITVKIDGMMCGMCESHMNDTFRQNFKVKKVSSSHAKGETVAIVDEDIVKYAAAEIDTLWDEITRFENPHTYYVDLSQKLWEVKNFLLAENNRQTAD